MSYKILYKTQGWRSLHTKQGCSTIEVSGKGDPTMEEKSGQEVMVCCMNECQSNQIVFGLQTKMGEIWFCYQCQKSNNDVFNGNVFNEKY